MSEIVSVVVIVNKLRCLLILESGIGGKEDIGRCALDTVIATIRTVHQVGFVTTIFPAAFLLVHLILSKAVFALISALI